MGISKGRAIFICIVFKIDEKAEIGFKLPAIHIGGSRVFQQQLAYPIRCIL
jgi:hypothetical protein